jgi:hypothetical protein
LVKSYLQTFYRDAGVDGDGEDVPVMLLTGKVGGAQKYRPGAPANWRQPWVIPAIPATAQEVPNPLRGQYKIS